jgi:hypothetical protein
MFRVVGELAGLWPLILTHDTMRATAASDMRKRMSKSYPHALRAEKPNNVAGYCR